jgi:hypothetical protein
MEINTFCKNLSLICTNLKFLSFGGFHIDDYSLSLLLESNQHCLVQLKLLDCPDITGMNILLPSLLTNIKELTIKGCVSLNEDGWNIMSMGLKNLTSLTYYSISVKMLRNTISNCVHLNYLDWYLMDML